MGFFSSAFGLVKRAASVFLGTAPAAGTQIVQAAPRIATRVSRLGRLGRGVGAAAAAGVGFAAGDVALSSLLDGGGGDGVPLAIGGGAVGGGCPGGATGNIVTTLVITRNADGDIICSKRLRGSPHLMNTDLIIAKRVRRVASQLAQKLVPKIRRQSKSSKLVEAIQDKVMRTVAQDVACPTT